MCPRPKEAGAVETHADSTMLQDMKVMIGSIQDAFVSIWVLDANQLRPFSSASGGGGARSRVQPAKGYAPPAPAAYAHSQLPVQQSAPPVQVQPAAFNRPPSANQQPLSRTPASVSSSTEHLAPEFQSRVAVSSRPITPATATAFPVPTSSAPGTGSRFTEDPRRSCTSVVMHLGVVGALRTFAADCLACGADDTRMATPDAPNDRRPVSSHNSIPGTRACVPIDAKGDTLT